MDLDITMATSRQLYKQIQLTWTAARRRRRLLVVRRPGRLRLHGELADHYGSNLITYYAKLCMTRPRKRRALPTPTYATIWLCGLPHLPSPTAFPLVSTLETNIPLPPTRRLINVQTSSPLTRS